MDPICTFQSAFNLIAILRVLSGSSTLPWSKKFHGNRVLTEGVKCIMFKTRSQVKILWQSSKHGQSTWWYFTSTLQWWHRAQSNEAPPSMVLGHIHRDFLRFSLYWIFLVGSCLIVFMLAATHMSVKPLYFQAPISSVDDMFSPNVCDAQFANCICANADEI